MLFSKSHCFNSLPLDNTSPQTWWLKTTTPLHNCACSPVTWGQLGSPSWVFRPPGLGWARSSIHSQYQVGQDWCLQLGWLLPSHGAYPIPACHSGLFSWELGSVPKHRQNRCAGTLKDMAQSRCSVTTPAFHRSKQATRSSHTQRQEKSTPSTAQRSEMSLWKEHGWNQFCNQSMTFTKAWHVLGGGIGLDVIICFPLESD